MAGRPSELMYVETPLLEQLKKLGWTVVQLDDSEKTRSPEELPGILLGGRYRVAPESRAEASESVAERCADR